jgi:hypothetical protein
MTKHTASNTSFPARGGVASFWGEPSTCPLSQDLHFGIEVRVGKSCASPCGTNTSGTRTVIRQIAQERRAIHGADNYIIENHLLCRWFKRALALRKKVEESTSI